MTEHGRRGRAARRAAPAARAVDYRHLVNPFTPQSVFSDDEIASMHDTALRVLTELGISVLLPEARSIFAAAGARVVDDMVFIGPDIVAEALRTAPRAIRLRGANPDRDCDYRPGALLFMAAGGCPNVSDQIRGRRPGTIESFREAIMLTQSFDAIHVQPGAPEAQDIPIQLRHYAVTEAQLTLSDKPIVVHARGRGQVRDSFEMIRRGLSLSEDDWLSGSWAMTVINSNSPRRLDRPMAQGIIDFARELQMTVITPFCLAGAMAPVTVAGALILQHAEALAGITLSQLARAGAPVSYGGFSSNVDLKSGAPAFGTPEHLKMQLGSGQLARFIGMPWRSAAGSAGNIPDMQAATENVNGIWGAAMAGATLIIHAAGWLEGGLTFGFEKFVCDMEAVQTMAEMCAPVPPDPQAFDALAEVQPGGHFFAAGHTMERYEQAFYAPLNTDLRAFGTWEAAGAARAEDRAVAIWRDRLDQHRPVPDAGNISERIADFVARRTAEGGAPPLED